MVNKKFTVRYTTVLQTWLLQDWALLSIKYDISESNKKVFLLDIVQKGDGGFEGFNGNPKVLR